MAVAQMRPLAPSAQSSILTECANKKSTHKECSFLLAQREGFEPSCGVIHKLISSQPRYDRFDTSAYEVLTNTQQGIERLDVSRIRFVTFTFGEIPLRMKF